MLFMQQPQVKEQSSHSTVCPPVWDWVWIGPLGQHPVRGQVLSHPTLRTNEALGTDVRQARRCCGSVT